MIQHGQEALEQVCIYRTWGAEGKESGGKVGMESWRSLCSPVWMQVRGFQTPT